MEDWVWTEKSRVEVIVSDGISPSHQLIKQLPPSCMQGVKRVDVVPERYPEAAEISANGTGLGIPAIQLQTPEELLANHFLQVKGRCCDYVFHAFRMGVTTKTLKLRRQQHRIGPVNLLRRITPSTTGASNVSMCRLNFLQGSLTPSCPLQQRVRRHWLSSR